MAESKRWWDGLGKRERAGLVAGVVAIAAATVALAYFTLRPDYQVLFSDLAPTDAAAMVAELDRMKATYRLQDDGATILVPHDVVHKTRLKLMGKDIPLRGAVGFELFNNADFGMTEFAQKVNYQRALQGEITRTILSIEGVHSARVHLAIPEQGLFRKTAVRAKASITVAMKPGRSLRTEQVVGIQRLVSAAVPDIAAQDVTIVNQSGVAVTRNAGAEAEFDASSTRLDAKRSTEEYLARKAGEVLENALGRGRALVSVDVRIDHNQSRVTTEDVLPAPRSSPEANSTGVVVRERQVVREPGAMPEGSKPQLAAGTTEIDYQVGRRVEQTVTAPGSIQRLNVAIVVKAPADKVQLDRVKELVAAAVGLDSKRGDGIAVYAMEQLAGIAPTEEPAATPPAPVQKAAAPAPVASVDREDRLAGWMPIALAIAFVLILALSLVTVARRRARPPKPAAPQPRVLTAAEREAVLRNVRQWVDMKPHAESAK